MRRLVQPTLCLYGRYPEWVARQAGSLQSSFWYSLSDLCETYSDGVVLLSDWLARECCDAAGATWVIRSATRNGFFFTDAEDFLEARGFEKDDVTVGA